jgi:hypothetical protein
MWHHANATDMPTRPLKLGSSVLSATMSRASITVQQNTLEFNYDAISAVSDIYSILLPNFEVVYKGGTKVAQSGKF